MSVVTRALRRNGCWAPAICSKYPYTCGCGLFVHAEYTAEECLIRLSKGLPIRGADTNEGSDLNFILDKQ